MTDKSLKSLGTWKLVVLLGLLAITNMGEGFQKDNQPACEKCQLGNTGAITFEPTNLEMMERETKSFEAIFAEGEKAANWSVSMKYGRDHPLFKEVQAPVPTLGATATIQVATADEISETTLFRNNPAQIVSDLLIQATPADPNEEFLNYWRYYPVKVKLPTLVTTERLTVVAGKKGYFVALIESVHPDDEWDFFISRLFYEGEEFPGSVELFVEDELSTLGYVSVDREYYQEKLGRRFESMKVKIRAVDKSNSSRVIDEIIHIAVLPPRVGSNQN